MMTIHRGRSLALVALTTLLATLFMAACSSTTTGTSTSNLTVLQVVQNSGNAMKQLKTVHFDMTLNGNVQGANAGTPIATPTSSGSPNQLTFNISAKGDQSFADQLQSTTLNVNNTLTLSEIVTADKVYVQNTKGQWYVIDKAKLSNMIGNPFSNVNIDPNTLLGLATQSNITDHGDESVNGQAQRHVTAVLDRNGLRTLLQNSPQIVNTLGKQNVDEILNNTKTFKATLDFWIDETQFYLHKLELKLNLNADTSSLATPAATVTSIPTNVASNLDTVINLSNFNQAVSITPPANATPTDDPSVIFH